MRFVFILWVSLLAGISNAQRWDLDPAASRLSLETHVYGSAFLASFTDFDADIVFDPNDLGQSQVQVRIATDSLSPTNQEDAIYVSEAGGADWFFSAKFPQAVFEAREFTDLGQGRYRATGTLQIKELVSPLSFDFTLEIMGDRARMRAQFPLDRLALGLGGLTHPNDNTVASTVHMSVDIAAVEHPARP